MNTENMLTMTPDEFAARFAPSTQEPDATPEDHSAPPNDYYIHNRETGKMELHLDKATYDNLTDAQKHDIKGAFLWESKSGCWISRWPNLHHAKRVAESLGFTDGGRIPDEFAAQFAPIAQELGATPEEHSAPLDDYYIHNRETGKLELHFDKSTYDNLTDAQKSEIKSNFLWGRKSGCWISRCKEPNLYFAKRVAESIGLTDSGKTGERLSFAEQQERKAERAERRAERFDNAASSAERRGEQLQKPINDMHGDVAFFTQPNINSSAGRAFTRRRERMFAAFDKGFEEFRKSEYYRDRAATARRTADQKEMKSKGFLMRRIAECESSIRKLRKSIDEWETVALPKAQAGTLKNYLGEPVTVECVESQIESWLDSLEAQLDKLGYYQDALDALGRLAFGKDNLKKGDLIYIERWREPVRFVRGGPKNFTYEFTLPHMKYADGSPMQGQAAYAEIKGRFEEPSASEDNP